MKLNKYELEIILQAVRKERYEAGRNFEESIKLVDKKLKDGEYITYGVADTLEILQRYNNLIFKLEEELREKNK